ncbi:hypothetical protein DW169_06070 [Bacteroides intestinalis]|nr:hypothetical protein DW169_06070 [Bacteroides intestinalis]
MPFFATALAKLCHHASKAVPLCWQSCAIMLAKLCYRVGKRLPIRWQNILNIIATNASLRDHCSVRLTIKIYSSFLFHSMHTFLIKTCIFAAYFFRWKRNIFSDLEISFYYSSS